MSDYDVIGLNLPCGYGKSYIARALQRYLGRTDIVTANNNLIDQYVRTYPELNVVKGKQHYATEQEYETAKRVARSSAPSIFNPLSALFTVPREVRQTDCIIVDEAHTLGEMLRTAATHTFNTQKAGIPKGCSSEYELARWAKQRFFELSNTGDPSQSRELEKVGLIHYALDGHQQDSLFSLRRSRTVIRGRRIETLSVTGVDYPTQVIDNVIAAEKTVLMSGTLTKYETERLANGRSWIWLSMPYVAPPENRPVYVRALERADRRDIPKVCAEISRIYMENDEQPMLVHVTYGDRDEFHRELQNMRTLLPRTSIIINSPTNKQQTEQAFRERGGIWLAAGCSEGVDLPDGFCRSIVLPRLHFPNKGDIYVQKRLGKPDGRRWYALKTLETTIQQLGRGVRHFNDHCKHYVFDPYFPALWEEYKDEFEPLAIKWGY